MEDDKSRFAIAKAELDESSIKASLKNTSSKILKSVFSELDEIKQDFFKKENEGYFLKSDFEHYVNDVMACVHHTVKVKKYIDGIIHSGERRLHSKAGGERSGILRQSKNEKRDENIIRDYEKLCAEGKKHNAASIIAKKNQLTPPQVRNIIRKKNEN